MTAATVFSGCPALSTGRQSGSRCEPFLDEMFTLTMLAFGILFFDGRDTDDAANVMVALGVGGQDTQ